MQSRHLVAACAAAVAVAMATVPAGGAVAVPAATSQQADASYTVLAEEGADLAAVSAAVRTAGGTVRATNAAIGTLTVSAPATGFVVAVTASDSVRGAAADRPIGKVPDTRARKARDQVEREGQESGAAPAPAAAAPSAADAPAPGAGMDPLDAKLWGLRMVRSDQARAVEPGNAGVLVGVLDTGIDGRHPDIAPNLDVGLSRNFTTDIPLVDDIDGACEFPERGCKDPDVWDDDGHGTHVSGTIAGAANGFGISGVAPGVRLVNLRGGQDSGYFFLGPVVNALTYGADVGVDIINMSFYIDPWLYNCVANPADSPEAQLEQRTIIEATRRALNYAHDHGVTLVGALGNNHENLGQPRTDTSSPDFPPGTAYPRPVDNKTCVDLPVEGPHVLGISALGPSGLKSDFSNYGVTQISFAAPGGWFRDGLGTATYRTPGNEVLSSYPVNALRASGQVDEAGNVLDPDFVLKQCPAGAADFTACGYYQYLQGTSMASPHAAGVAALAVSAHGRGDAVHGGMTMKPDYVERTMVKGARQTACPDPRYVRYDAVDRDSTYDAYCKGPAAFNAFYGHGIVDALGVVRDS